MSILFLWCWELVIIGYYVWNKTPESIFQITRGQARNQFTTPGGAFYDTHCFVTAVLWSMLDLSYSSETVLRLDNQILLNSNPPKNTDWVRPCREPSRRTPNLK